MWNSNCKTDRLQPFPPRILQRPRYRLGAPALTIRHAELYGLLPYRKATSNAGHDEITKQRDIERAVIRGVRFVEGVYKGKYVNGDEVGPWTIKDGKFCSTEDEATIDKDQGDIPICSAAIEVLTPRSADGKSLSLLGQDKYLGGMASPCGRYIYGVPVSCDQYIGIYEHFLPLSCSTSFHY